MKSASDNWWLVPTVVHNCSAQFTYKVNGSWAGELWSEALGIFVLTCCGLVICRSAATRGDSTNCMCDGFSGNNILVTPSTQGTRNILARNTRKTSETNLTNVRRICVRTRNTRQVAQVRRTSCLLKSHRSLRLFEKPI